MTAKNRCQIVVGRLIEVEVSAGYRTVEDVDAVSSALAELVRRHPDIPKFVVAADWRRCGLLSPEVAARIVQLMSTTYERIERTAILHERNHPTSAFQVFRVVSEARQVVPAARRPFTVAREMHDWLGEVLSVDERERLLVFLDSAR